MEVVLACFVLPLAVLCIVWGLACIYLEWRFERDRPAKTRND